MSSSSAYKSPQDYYQTIWSFFDISFHLDLQIKKTHTGIACDILFNTIQNIQYSQELLILTIKAVVQANMQKQNKKKRLTSILNWWLCHRLFNSILFSFWVGHNKTFKTFVFRNLVGISTILWHLKIQFFSQLFKQESKLQIHLWFSLLSGTEVVSSVSGGEV